MVGNSRSAFLTSKERDNESGLDYFGARYYSGAQGRFTSPDPFELVLDAEDEDETLSFLSDPRSWNKYAYTYNNPLRFVDPDGQRPQDSFHNRFEHIHRQRQEGKISEQQYWEQLRGPFVGTVAGLGAVGAVALAVRSPQIAQAILLWAARNPDKVQQIAGAVQEAGGGPPVVGPALNVNAVAKSFGFKAGFAATDSLVGGELKNGATVLANFSKTGNQLAVNISFVAGGQKGTLKAIEQGIGAAAKEAGASSVRIIATNPNDRVKNLLLRKGFTEVVKDGKGAGQWEKVVKVQ